jgi:hypothetical protein
MTPSVRLLEATNHLHAFRFLLQLSHLRLYAFTASPLLLPAFIAFYQQQSISKVLILILFVHFYLHRAS